MMNKIVGGVIIYFVVAITISAWYYLGFPNDVLEVLVAVPLFHICMLIFLGTGVQIWRGKL